MIFVSDIFAKCQQLLGTADTALTYSAINRAIRILRNKASNSNVTWDPSLIYCNLSTSSGGYQISLPYQIEKPIAINLNSTPAFTRGQLFEFTMNGPGSTDPLVGWQWMDQGTKPLQVPLPVLSTQTISNGTPLLFTSDNAGDVAVNFICTVQMLDSSEQTISIPLNTLSQNVLDLLVVNKPVTLGNITVTAGDQIVAVYPPSVTNPRFFQLKISQPGNSVRILGRRRYIDVANSTDFIPLESIEAIIMMVKAVKYYDEDQYQAAEECETKAVQWLQEDNASRLLYAAAAQATQTPPILNLNIYNRDSVIVGDIYEEACAAFGPIGQQQIFDKITTVLETLQNMSQWDPQIGYVDIQAFGGPDGNQFYLTLPRYVEEVMAMNVNARPARRLNKWFEFHMNGLFQDNSDGKYPFPAGAATPGLWTNRSSQTYEDVGEVVFAFDPLPVNQPFNLIAIAVNPMDQGKDFRAYGYDANGLAIFDTDGTQGILVPVGTGSSIPAPNPAGRNMVRCERIFRDPSAGFIDLWQCDSSGNKIQYLSSYWPDETEPKYRRIRLGSRPVTTAASTTPRYPVVRIRYRKRWLKIASLTDPIHLKSRQSILTAFQGAQLRLTNSAGAQGAIMERACYEQAVKYLNDEWVSTHPGEGLDIQVDATVWPALSNSWEAMT